MPQDVRLSRKRGWDAGGPAEKCLLRHEMPEDVRAGGGSDGARLDRPHRRGRLGHGFAVLAQALDVGVDGLSDQLLGLGARFAGCHAPGRSGTQAPQLVGPCS